MLLLGQGKLVKTLEDLDARTLIDLERGFRALSRSMVNPLLLRWSMDLRRSQHDVNAWILYLYSDSWVEFADVLLEGVKRGILVRKDAECAAGSSIMI